MLWTLLAVVLCGYGATVLMLATFQRSMIYLPDTGRPDPAVWGMPDVQVVTLQTADGLDLRAWYRAPREEGQPLIVYFHGNGGHLGYRSVKLRPYLQDGLGLLMVSYRGYGGNPGDPSEKGLMADGRAALDWVAERGMPPRRTVVYGESLGSGVAVAMAAERAATGTPLGAVVLEAPFTSLAEAAAWHYPLLPARWLVIDRYDSLSRIDAIGAPLLVVHGEQDNIVPVSMGRELLAAADQPKAGMFPRLAGHNDLDAFGLADSVRDFLSDHVD
ncbi:MAG: alpha/beta hydrolase [Acetobacterales bacterium]